MGRAHIQNTKVLYGRPCHKGRQKCYEMNQQFNRMNKTLFVTIVLILLCNVVHANKVESKFIHAKLVDVNIIDRTIHVDLVNSDPQKNYFRENYYSGLNTAYLQREVAIKLSKAQKLLSAKHRNYSLLILDAARPRSVSQSMYDKMKGTRFEKYVANPQKGSMHNYGIAVDITIVDGK